MASAKHLAKMVEDLICLAAWGETSTPRSKEKWHPPDEGQVKISIQTALLLCR
jgi:hypothetical protein